ncbi:nodulation protein NfeD [Dissulfurirhabdus thermomarina]|uniref:Nodulation protein NfeD n=1 Tax=Dissulfurirhabdus thermomarina TaxID=1765737 RepID=A0A6N9TMR4_DISTH|nr:nodulation protein NfeD [Dissulfurirhabdus thermomarina]NDY42348.1 nodulation protein NfeD [Dissulfurirhabdus thermomarina]NMX24216.1 nodulation protein NfeD [Dissulfurirhabdus thermomarina]
MTPRNRNGRRPGAGRLALALVLLLLGLAAAAGAATPPPAPHPVFLVRLEGTINPGTALYLRRALREAAAARAACLVVELDTPGGLVASLRSMVQDVMASPVPVVVYVAPAGARAASAGALLTLAAHVAAMAPGTNIGAAHPVELGRGAKDETLSAKAENDLAAMARSVAGERGRNVEWAEKAVRESVSATAREALRLGVVDLLARDRAELLERLHGRRVTAGGSPRVIETRDAEVRVVREGLRERLLRAIADPNVAYILMMIGMVGLYFELAHPGVILPGTIGAISLLLGLYALQALPVNTIGLLLILLAMGLFVLEILVTSYGILGFGGVVALILGSLLLFDTPETGVAVAAAVLWPTVLLAAAAISTVVYLVVRVRIRRPETGLPALVGARGTAREAVDARSGRVFLHGEYWNARSPVPIPPGREVVVERVEGLTLHVVPADEHRGKDAPEDA